MARFRKEKGGSNNVRTPKNRGKTDGKRHSQQAVKRGKKDSEDAVLKEQVLVLGGDQDDYDLIKDVNETSTPGSYRHDPALSKDVSKFLKELNLSETNAQESVDQQKDKSQGTPRKRKPSRNNNAEPATVPRPEPRPAPVVPSVQSYTKVSLNAKSRFLIQPIAQWYNSIQPLGSNPASTPTITPTQLSSLTSRVSTLHSADVHTFQTSSSQSSSSEASFFFKIIQSGTLSDRLSALTLLVQNSPFHNTKALDTLKGMAERGKGKGGREESLKALRCIVDWWVGGGAPNRKLKYFRDQPLLHPSVTDHHLLLWYFEDWLKKYFFSILQILEILSLDPLPYVRTQALTLIFTLLRDKPEQEQNLLRLLVNKLGDTEKTLSSRASYYLLQLLQTHPSMKSIVVREVMALVLRPTAPITTSLPSGAGKHTRFTNADHDLISKPTQTTGKKTGNPHARYYATITFNQIVLTPEDREVALQLIEVYFEIFKELLGEGREASEEDAKDEGKQGNEPRMDKGGRVIDGGRGKGNGNRKGKGKFMEVKGAAGFAEVEDAQSKLISAILTGVNRALPFAKINTGDVRLSKHIDTLFVITHTSTFNISLQALVLIQQITATLASASASTSKSITDRYYRTLYASLHDPRLSTSSKQAMYLNLLFKSIKADPGNTNAERAKALVRRFTQILVSGGNGATEFVAGGLYLLGELFSTVSGLRDMVNSPCNSEGEVYDPWKRDPQFAHSSSSPLWELTPLLHHYHPTVALHARQLLSSQPLTASADLSLNTLSHFLDRFVYKNPKKLKPNAIGSSTGKTKGASAMQPAASEIGGRGVKLIKGEVEDVGGRVNEERFWKRRAEDIPVDQLFFHKYFSKKNEREKANVAKANKINDPNDESASDSGFDEAEGEDDGEHIESSEDDDGSKEAEIWKAMKASMPQAASDDDLMEDSDELPSDFDVGDNQDESDAEEIEEVDASDDDLSLVEDSDDEDLIPLDDDSPDGLINCDDPDAKEDEEWGGIVPEGGKRKRADSSKERRKKLKSLPAFASYEDYAKMIEDEPEDDI